MTFESKQNAYFFKTSPLVTPEEREMRKKMINKKTSSEKGNI